MLEWKLMGHILRQYDSNEYGWELQSTWFAEDGSDQRDFQLAGRGFVEGRILYLSAWTVRHGATQESIRQFAEHRDALVEWNGTEYVAWLDGLKDAEVCGTEKHGAVAGGGVPDDVRAEIQAVIARVPFLGHVQADDLVMLPEH